VIVRQILEFCRRDCTLRLPPGARGNSFREFVMRKLRVLAGAVLLVFALASPRVRAADEVAPNHRPVKEVASLGISVGTQGCFGTCRASGTTAIKC
jgi:hypothetical protein